MVYVARLKFLEHKKKKPKLWYTLQNTIKLFNKKSCIAKEFWYVYSLEIKSSNNVDYTPLQRNIISHDEPQMFHTLNIYGISLLHVIQDVTTN